MVQKFGNGDADVCGAHECFSDENGVTAPVEDFLCVGTGFYSTLADEDDVIWHLFTEGGGGFEVDSEVDEIAVIDADDFCAEVEGAVEFSQVVNFDEAFQL